ncbi:MAG: InlB B-repeat-containing protein [Clostridia bacterium]|nr:InlB B-repeat-containing protein [Clostridia bacterium]
MKKICFFLAVLTVLSCFTVGCGTTGGTDDTSVAEGSGNTTGEVIPSDTTGLYDDSDIPGTGSDDSGSSDPDASGEPDVSGTPDVSGDPDASGEPDVSGDPSSSDPVPEGNVKVTFDASGATGTMAAQTIPAGVDTALNACTYTQNGYTFAGWATSAGGAVVCADGQNVNLSADTTLYAVWKANTFTVRYNANGGSGSMADTAVTYDTSTAIRINTFTRSGYDFMGWYRYRTYDNKWYYTDGSSSGWYEKDKQPAGYELSVLGDGKNVSRTSPYDKDVCVFYAVWNEHIDGSVSLKGKKVIFIGSSMIYYCHCTNKGSQGQNDKGYFYQLCNAVGQTCTVTDCTYPSHSVDEFITKCNTCSTPADHLKGLDLASYDFVFVCQVTSKSNMVDTCKKIKARFPSTKTKFVYMDSTYTYQQNYTVMKNQLNQIKDLGYMIVSFGSLCYDVWKGTTKVPGTSLTYNKETFIINGNDANHPNLLTGYIEAAMCFCAVTGGSAVGLPYGFVTDKSINSAYDTASFIKTNYTKKTTNFDKVLASPVDMKGIQALIDQYNTKWGCGPGQKQEPVCQHTFVKSQTPVFKGCSNTKDDYLYVCSKCGKAGDITSVASTGNKDRKNVLLTSVTKHCGTSDPGVIGYSSINGTAKSYDGIRSMSGGGILAWRLKSKTPSLEADGSAGSTYCGGFAYSFTSKTSINGFTVFTDASSVITDFDVLGGTKDSSGKVTWKVLWSGSDLVKNGKFLKYDESTSYITADFTAASVDYVMFGIKSATGTSFNISEAEVYSPVK